MNIFETTVQIAFKIVLTAKTIRTGSILLPLPRAAAANKSLLTKPEKIGIPTMEREPTVNPSPAILLRKPAPVRKVKGRFPLDTSVKPIPAINRRDLVAAWAII